YMNIKILKMKLFAKIAAICFSMALFVSCGNADDDVKFGVNPGGQGPGGGDLGIGKPVDDCLKLGDGELVLSIQNQSTALPGKVSIFFKVSDAQGNPVSGLKADQFTIYEQGRNDTCFNTISTSESYAKISPNSQIFNNNTILVLDLSNSVLSSSLTELQAATVSFIENVMPASDSESFKMAIYWFDGEDKLHSLEPLTHVKQDLIAAVQEITKDISNDPSTDLYGAVIKSTDIAGKLLSESTTNGRIGAASVVIFTDGTDQASRYTQSAAVKKVTDADKNISFFSIGLGEEIDADILRKLGKTLSVNANNNTQLEATFNQISERVSERANSFYLFEYCSPKRDGSGESNLAIQVKAGSRQGSVQTKFNAKGFTGGCK
ncbi:MAG TPA: VWA domain-containing protein, partial [Arenibacter sp.]|nr:VWA domain-containing protein [Arenibacter sp.]